MTKEQRITELKRRLLHPSCTLDDTIALNFAIMENELYGSTQDQVTQYLRDWNILFAKIINVDNRKAPVFIETFGVSTSDHTHAIIYLNEGKVIKSGFTFGKIIYLNDGTVIESDCYLYKLDYRRKFITRDLLPTQDFEKNGVFIIC